MNKLLIVALLISSSALAQSYPQGYNGTTNELAKVTSVIAVTEQAAVGQNCELQTQTPVQKDNSTAGTIVGGIVGGLIGHQIGAGSGQTAATIIGATGGAVAGNYAASQPPAPQTVQVCRTVTQPVITGYRFQAEWDGKLLNGYTRRPINVGDMVNVRVNRSANIMD